MVRRFKDFYGCESTIEQKENGKWLLRTCTDWGLVISAKEYKTERGARTALGLQSDGTAKEIIADFVN